MKIFGAIGMILFLWTGHVEKIYGQAHDVYLTGNLADIKGNEGLLKAFDQLFLSSENDFTLILNGDNVDHFIDTNYSDIQLQHLYQFIDLVSIYPQGKLVINTGDREWNSNKSDGYEAVLQFEKAVKKYIKENKYDNIYFLTKNACPGPYDIELDVHLLLVSVNSQWWNHKYDKPTSSDAICKYATQMDIIEELESLIDDNYNMNILFLAHHPIKSLGNYGGRYSLRDQLKPFPIYGFFKNAYRSNIGTKEDLSNPYIKPYIHDITNTLFFRSDLIMATSHEKNHQIMRMNQNYLVNSGALGKKTHAASDYTTELAESSLGFIKLEYKYDGTINSEYFTYDKKKKVFSKDSKKMLYSSACLPGQVKEDVDDNLAYISCQLVEELAQDVTEDLSKQELAKAGPQYQFGNFGRFWLGDHYRTEWATPIKINYLNIDTTFRGLDAYRRGGGRQTTSLKFKSGEGDYYTFRSVDKDPSKVLDYRLRNSVLDGIFRDQTSAQHPYGALIVATLLDKIGILHVDPKLYLLPDLTALGPFQKEYGGMMGMLEMNPGKANNKGDYFAVADDILKSNQLFRKLYKNKTSKINQAEFLRARLFDILIGDWSRHEDNWKWAEYSVDGKKIFRPIPRDRDQAFTKWDGVLPSLADREWGLPNTENFDYTIKGFKSLVFQAKYMDRFLLTESSKEDFIREANFIKNKITDLDIDEAVKKMPPEVYPISGEEIASKLKSRKLDLEKYAIKYYNWLSNEVEVLGSRDDDYIKITHLSDASIKVQILEGNINTSEDQLIYERTFLPKETKRVKVYSLGGNDIFDMKGDFQGKIDLILIGGDGTDKYQSAGNARKIKILDHENVIINGTDEKFEVVKHWDEKVYQYDRERLKFDYYLPLLNINYSSYNGLTLGAGVYWKNHGWDKREYSSRQELVGGISTKGDVGIEYDAKWKQKIRKWDITAKAKLFNPEFYNSFYGIGNGTTLIDNLKMNDYYVTSYNLYSGQIGLSRKFWRNSSINFNTGYETYANKKIEYSIVDDNNTSLVGSHKTLGMIPLTAGLDIDLRNHHTFPSRGTRIRMDYNNYYVTDNDFRNWHGTFDGSLELYMSTYNSMPFTLGLKVGGTHGYGNVPFYMQPNLGSNSSLRGYTSFRFTGNSRLYFNSELRWDLFQLERVLANHVGLTFFFDMGRVYADGDDAGDLAGFHTGYGAGFFITPASRSITISIQFAFSEENSFYPRFNIGTPLSK